MISRTILALFGLAVIAAATSAAPAGEVNANNFVSDEIVERGILTDLLKMKLEAIKTIVQKVLDTLSGGSKKADAGCTKEINNNCKINPLLHPFKYSWCAKKYILEHKSKCLGLEENQDESEEKSEQKPVEKPEEKPEEKPTKKPEEKTEKTPEGKSEEQPKEVPKENPEEKSEEQPKEVPEGKSEEKTEEEANELIGELY